MGQILEKLVPKSLYEDPAGEEVFEMSPNLEEHVPQSLCENLAGEEVVEINEIPEEPLPESLCHNPAGEEVAEINEIMEEPLCHPPAPPKVIYYYSKVSAANICFLYRVTAEVPEYRCHPEAKGWPELRLSKEELDQHFRELSEDKLYHYESPASIDSGSSLDLVRYPGMNEFRRQWHVGCNVFFRYNDIRNRGIVMGRFVWEEKEDCSKVRILLLLKFGTATNGSFLLRSEVTDLQGSFLLSSEVTDLQLDPGATKDEGKAYIQGISAVAIVATLIASVTYAAGVTPPPAPVPHPFHSLNYIAFYTSMAAVWAVVILLPICGPVGEWNVIFFVSFFILYVGFIFFTSSFVVNNVNPPRYILSWLILALTAVLIVLHILLMIRNFPPLLIRNFNAWLWYLERAYESGNTLPTFLHNPNLASTLLHKCLSDRLNRLSTLRRPSAYLRTNLSMQRRRLAYLLTNLSRLYRNLSRLRRRLAYLLTYILQHGPLTAPPWESLGT